MPKPTKGESTQHFVGRYMGSEETKTDSRTGKKRSQAQRLAIAYSESSHRKRKAKAKAHWFK